MSGCMVVIMMILAGVDGEHDDGGDSDDNVDIIW